MWSWSQWQILSLVKLRILQFVRRKWRIAVNRWVCVWWISCQVLSPVLTRLTFLILHGFPHLRSCHGHDWVGGTVFRATTHNPSYSQFKSSTAVYSVVTAIIALIRLPQFLPVILWSIGAQLARCVDAVTVWICYSQQLHCRSHREITE